MIDVLFVLTLFLVFAFSALALLTLGANIYQKTANHMSVNFNSRTSFAYVTQKLRTMDEADSVSVGTFDGCDAILMKENINNTIYITYLYAYDGNLYELTTRADIALNAEAGNPIVAVNKFSITQENSNLYRVSITTVDDENIVLLLSTHAKGGNNP